MNDISDTPTKPDRRAAYRRRMAEKGYRQLLVWIPERDAERVRSYARALGQTFEKERRAAEKAGAGRAE